MPVRYQGCDIPLTVTIPEQTKYTDVDDFERIVAYFYTNEANIVKFEWRADGQSTGDEYVQMTPSADRKSLTAMITSEHTLQWHGTLYCDYLTIDADDNTHMIKRQNTGLEIRRSLIRQEVETANENE